MLHGPAARPSASTCPGARRPIRASPSSCRWRCARNVDQASAVAQTYSTRTTRAGHFTHARCKAWPWQASPFKAARAPLQLGVPTTNPDGKSSSKHGPAENGGVSVPINGHDALCVLKKPTVISGDGRTDALLAHERSIPGARNHALAVSLCRVTRGSVQREFRLQRIPASSSASPGAPRK